MIKLNVVEFFISLLDKLGNLILVHRKDKPIFKIDGFSTDPISKSVVVYINNTSGNFFIIKKVQTSKNLKYIGYVPKNVFVDDIVDLRFRYIGDLETPSKDSFYVKLHIKNQTWCNYKYKFSFQDDRIISEY